MLRSRVGAGVAIRRIITAQGCSTLLARPQMNPSIADFHALLAFPAFGMSDVTDGAEMDARRNRHGKSLLIPLDETLDEREHLIRDLSPSAVDRERVSVLGHLEELGY